MNPEDLNHIPPKILTSLADFALEEFKNYVPDIIAKHFNFAIDIRPAPIPYTDHWLIIPDEDGYEYRIVLGIRAYPNHDTASQDTKEPIQLEFDF